ncbi:hypothetical protein [Bradyrhizobium sp.]|uniref:hypothetical protein n=1 Tax=Bradyrhizobium sp. TaxID=376 RepID=UPI002D7F1A56|nr:hypothetical protein [Bradyrhizobium sp.]
MSDPVPEPGKLAPESSTDEKPKPAQRQHSRSGESNIPAMAGLAIAVVLLALGLWLAHELRAASKMQDCLMSGRTNCNQIQP